MSTARRRKALPIRWHAASFPRSARTRTATWHTSKTGWTSDELIQGIEDAAPEGSFNLVSLLIGVNNQYRGWSPEEFRTEFIDLLGMATGFAGGNKNHVIVLSIPDWGVMPFARGRDRQKISDEIDLYNSIISAECEKEGMIFFDITEISRKAENDSTLVAGDGLHPSGQMYAMWVNSIYEEVFNLLK